MSHRKADFGTLQTYWGIANCKALLAVDSNDYRSFFYNFDKEVEWIQCMGSSGNVVALFLFTT